MYSYKSQDFETFGLKRSVSRLSYIAHIGNFFSRQTEPEAIACSFPAFIKLAASPMVKMYVFLRDINLLDLIKENNRTVNCVIF